MGWGHRNKWQGRGWRSRSGGWHTERHVAHCWGADAIMASILLTEGEKGRKEAGARLKCRQVLAYQRICRANIE